MPTINALAVLKPILNYLCMFTIANALATASPVIAQQAVEKKEKATPAATSTLGLAPPAEAVVLFDGSNLDAWKPFSFLHVNPRDNQKEVQWKIVDGKAFEITPEFQGKRRLQFLCTKQRFGDYRLHLEFQLPEDGGKGNSGVFFGPFYEMQILDSSKKEKQGLSDCGAIYHIRVPDQNAALAPGQWQTVDLEFQAARFNIFGRMTENKAARVTIRLNGVLIHDDFKLSVRRNKYATFKEEPLSPIVLQDHGSPVKFRNIWVVEKPAKVWSKLKNLLGTKAKPETNAKPELKAKPDPNELTVASPFTDNAVLQRDMSVPVWGTAGAGTKVTVEFAGQKKFSLADANGRWKVHLDPMPANTQPQVLQVSAPQAKISFSNVLLGEVWICTGQSNMQMGYKSIPDIKALLQSTENIRSFDVRRTAAFTEQDQCEGQWVEQVPNSAVAFAFAYFLEEAANVPIGIIQTSWGSSSIEGWMPKDMTQKLPHFKEQMDAFDADTEKLTRIKDILNGPKPWDRKSDIFLRTQPNIIFNAMMHPLIPYQCRGLVWYQGEANSKTISGMLQYDDSLTAWIKHYRQQWGREDLHFLAVMLPGFAKNLELGPKNPSAHSWAWMRESQLNVLELQHTGVANTIDLGDATNIHPKDKLPIGKRLALLAARDTLGQKKIQAHGPTMSRVEVQEAQLIVHFDHASGLKTLDDNTPTGFWLADDSGKWMQAQAKLEDQTVVLSSPDLEKPLYVRYAFAGKPEVNLVNGDELPAYPFRTDSFEP